MWSVFAWMTCASLLELASIFSLTLFFRLIYSPQFIFQIPGMGRLMNVWPHLRELAQDPKQVMLWGCLLPVALIFLKNIFQAIVSWKSSVLSEHTAAYIGNRIMEKYLTMPYSWHLSSQKALAVLAMQRRFSLGNMLLNILMAYSNLITACMLFCGLFFYSPTITGATVICMLIISSITYFSLKKSIDRAGAASAKSQERESIVTQTALAGVRELIIYQKQPEFLREIHKSVSFGIAPRAFLLLSPAVPTWTLESSGFFLIWLTIYGMLYFSGATHAQVSETIALLALTAWRVLPALNRIVSATVRLRELKATALPCLDYMESLEAQETPLQISPDPAFEIKKDIIFDDISYTYPDAKTPALKNISCRIPIGSTIGLVGRSGSGKSTFINILCGLLDPKDGQLLIDGSPMSPPQLRAYRRQMGYVPQSPYILDGTVAENVAFCDWGGEIDNQRVQAACQEAAIDFLGEHCENIDRKAGHSLSGGQMQRVSIARALYARPTLLIFDEATSALDQGAEAKIQEAMRNSRGQRTNIIAAHRLETLEICDFIFWLENGELIRSGPAKEILRDYREAIVKAIR